MRKFIAVILHILISLNTAVKGSDFDPDSLISEVLYDYDITSGENDGKSWVMCFGTLSMSISVPNRTESIEFWRANGPTVHYHYPPFYNIRQPIDISGKSKVDVNFDYVGADSYFRVVFNIGGKTYYSSHFAINDLIIPDDLKILQETNSSVETIVDDSTIEVISGGILVKSKSACKIEIISIEGRSYYQGIICEDITIPLQAGVYIIRQFFNNKFESKKVIIK